MLKQSENPAMLPGEASLPSDLPGQAWWVAHTKSRQEKTFAWDLHKARTGYYLPLIERTIVSGGRKRRVMKPLFGSYVFFCGDEETRYQAMTTNRLCTVLPVAEPERFLGELDQIHRAILGEAKMDPYPGLAEGRLARVRAGSFQGLEGTIVEWAGQTRLVLQVAMLGQGAAVEIDADLLDPIEGEAPTGPRGGLQRA